MRCIVLEEWRRHNYFHRLVTNGRWLRLEYRYFRDIHDKWCVDSMPDNYWFKVFK